ncbi:MAG TPA: chemotaxis protein CheW [Bacillota bacterium]|nr:chemotaxis protein CheW [Bacillota bacterium]
MAEQQYVIFQLGQETFALDIAKVWEIINFQQITKVPQATEFIEGIINLRGKVIPVLDLRRRFGLSAVDDNKAMRIIVVEIAGHVTGLMVDGVSEVLRFSDEIVEAPPAAVTNVDEDFIEGVAKLQDRLIIILCIEKVLASRNTDMSAAM